MNYTIINLTESQRSQNPQEGDLLRYIYENGTIKNKTFREPSPITSEEIEDQAKQWRNSELESTDWIVPLIDYPDHSAILTYRQKLRNWPSMDSFPETKPTL